MSLKAAFVLFYILFISLFSFITFQMGLDVLGINTDEFLTITSSIADPATNPIGVFFEIIVNTIFFALKLFYLFFIINVTIPEFALLNIIFILPFSVVMLYMFLEYVRGIA